MADFRESSGGSGKWQSSTNTLSLKSGKTGELILWGSGPAGNRKLTICLRNGNLLKWKEVASGSTSERLFRFKAKGPGLVYVYARIGNCKGNDYSKPAKIVILPKKVSSLGKEHVVLFAGQAKDEDDIALESYQKAVAKGGTAYRIKSSTEFFELLTLYRNGGRRISRMEINTHGAPGIWSFGNGTAFTKASLAYFNGNGFHNVFARGARIFFHGCNIAEGKTGENFLKAFGKTFLKSGGGSVGASTSVGFGTGFFGGSKVYHLWGDTVRVYFSKTGAVDRVEKK